MRKALSLFLLTALLFSRACAETTALKPPEDVSPFVTDAQLARYDFESYGFSILLPDGSPVTLSAGIAAFPEDGNTYSEIVRKADGAMYRGKLVGHNRVCLAREEKMITKTSHYTADQLKRLTKVSKAEGVGEAVLLREALDTLLRKYDA